MHVVLGERWLAAFGTHYSEQQRKLFLLGTVFPDIRYLGVIKRGKSHFKGVTLKEVYQAPTPFQQGVLFHSFVDEYRNRWIKQKISKMDKIPKQGRQIFLKLVEDEILCPQYQWGEFRGFLTTIADQEKAYDIDLAALTQWHAILAIYFSTSPSFILSQFGLFKQEFLTIDAATVKEWSLLLIQCAADPFFREYVNHLLQAFDDLLQESKIK